MLQNNDFVKAFYPEVQLPEHQRLSLVKRLLRLGCYLLLFLAVSAQISVSYGRIAEIEKNSVSQRVKCQRACQLAHFPSVSCSTRSQSHKVTLHGNTYESLWLFKKPLAPGEWTDQLNLNKTDSEDDGRAQRKVDFNRRAMEDFKECRSHALDPAPVRKITDPDEGRRERMHICFSQCRRSTETAEHGYGEDTREVCMCEKYMVDPVARITALRPCSNSGQACQPCDLFDDLLCVDTRDPIERPLAPAWVCLNKESHWCMSWGYIWMVVAISNALQLGVEMCFYYTSAETEDVYEFQSATTKCALQFFIVLWNLVAMLILIGPFSIMGRLERSQQIWLTFVFGLMTDQAKSFIVQPIIWWVIIRRCGLVNPGIQEYNEEYIMQWDLEESLMETLRRKVHEFLEWRPIMFGVVGLVGLYSLFVLASLSLQSYIEGDKSMENIFSLTDFAFLCVFMLEIVLKIFAYGFDFIFDVWNAFDSSIVIVSFSFFFLETTSSRGLTLLRLLRLMRVMMVMRKVSDQRKKMQTLKRAGAFEMGSNVDKVLEIIEELQNHPSIEPHVRNDLDWVHEMITSNKLYSMALMDDEEGNETKTAELNAWIHTMNDPNLQDAPKKNTAITEDRQSVMVRDGALGSVVRNSKAQHSKLGSTVRGSARGSRRQSRRQSEQKGKSDGSLQQLHAYLYTVAELTPAEEGQIEQALEPLDQWAIDFTTIGAILDVHLLPIVFSKITISREIVTSLKFDFDLMYRFCTHVQASYHPQVAFHNVTHAADMIQSCHYFLNNGLDKCLQTHLDKFTFLLNALVAHMGHPGLTNDFLVKVRHPQAICYNDKAVTQNYCLASVFAAMYDPEMNFMLHLKQEQVDALRRNTISNVLKLDMRAHFAELSLFTTKCSSDDFPSDSNEDRMVMMSMGLRIADLSWTGRPLQTYVKWSEKFLEELFMQGDLEKQLGSGVSLFCDRDLVNTTKTNLSFTLVVSMPVMSSFCMIIEDDQLQFDVITEGLEKNQVYLQSWST